MNNFSLESLVIPNLVVACTITAGVFFLLERLRPARPLEKVKVWWERVVFVNVVQACIVIVGGYVWDPFFAKLRFSNGLDGRSPLVGGLIAYFVLSFVYYWWHRWRHEIPFFWKWLHQVHHSPSRIETITSFYKHPFEILSNTLITSFTLYIVLGVTVPQATWAVYFLAVAEYCYHVNVRTPRWLGYFIQRPEMHRLHHKRGAHRYNYADLPIWDMLFGTFRNPVDQPDACGLGLANEVKLGAMLRGEVFEDVF